MQVKHIAGLLLVALLLCGCGIVPIAETVPETTAAPEAILPDPLGLRLTQEENVRKATYEGKTAYTEFMAAARKRFLIPGLKQVLTPQGIAVCPNTGRTYISAYVVDDIPSVICVMEAGTDELVASYHLYNADGSPCTSHVGGVAVTETHLYVSNTLDSDGSYTIAAIPLENLPGEGSHDITVSEVIAMAVSPSMMNYSGGYLWVGNFYHPKADYNLSPNLEYSTPSADGAEYGCYILGFDMTGGHDRLLSQGGFPVPDVILAAPDRIQGVTLAGENQVVLSQSYGRANDSTLFVYDLDLHGTPDLELPLAGNRVPGFVLDSHRLQRSINAIPMTEGLAQTSDGQVLVLFESGAIRYEDGKHRTSYVWSMTVQ